MVSIPLHQAAFQQADYLSSPKGLNCSTADQNFKTSFLDFIKKKNQNSEGEEF